MKKLGQDMIIIGFSIKGNLIRSRCREITKKIIRRIGMSIIPKSAFFSYPCGGKGGVGFTYVQAISESFLAWDVWPDHGGGYLIICSCKKFRIKDVIEVLREEKLKATVGINGKLSIE